MDRRSAVSLSCLGLLVASLVHCGGTSGVGVGEGSNLASGSPEDDSSATRPDPGTGCTTANCSNPDNTTCDGGTCSPTITPGAASSCSRQHGGKTCGPNGDEDCCAVATQGKYTIDKYLITAGRMRAFVEQTQGNVQGFVQSLGAKWKPEWNEADSLPTDMASANEFLGPYRNKKSCNNGQYTGHTYWTPKAGDDYSDFDQDTLDEKALNCVPWAMLQALCAWDGGHLATLAELKAGFTNDGTTKYPWGNEALTSVTAPDPKERLNIEGAFATTPIPANARKDGDGNPLEASFRISPPGRFPNGNNKAGIADSAGNLLEWVGDRPRQFVWKADWEHHAANAATLNLANFGNWWWEKPLPIGDPFIWGTNQLFGQAGGNTEKNGYYTIGGRCAH